MADLLTAAQRAQLSGLSPNVNPTYSLTIINSAIGSVGVSDRIIKPGELHMVLANYHPARRSTLRIPSIVLVLANDDGYFAEGKSSGAFPGVHDREGSTAVYIVTVCEPPRTVLSLVGQIEPLQYDDDGSARMTILSPLQQLRDVKWKREQRSEALDTGAVKITNFDWSR